MLDSQGIDLRSAVKYTFRDRGCKPYRHQHRSAMWHIRGYRFGLAVAIVALLLHGPTSSDGRMSSSVETVCSSFSSSSSSSCTQRLMIEMEVHGDDKLQFEWEAGDINGRSPKQSDAGNQGVVVTVQKTPVSYSYRLNYIKAVPFNWIEYAHRALHWQVKDGGENFCSETWANKCSDEHGEEGFPLHPGNGLPVDGAEGKCCWCTAVWHLWLGNSNPGREPKLKCNFWGLRFGSSPDPYLTKFCPVVEFPWYRMLKVSEERTWFFKIHVGIGWWQPPSLLQLSNEAYVAECENRIAEGKYPANYDCAQKLHSDAGMADVILELSDSTKAARDYNYDVTARLSESSIGNEDEPNVKGQYLFLPWAPESDPKVQESIITEGCSTSEDPSAWGVDEQENPDLVKLCKSGSPFCNLKSCLRHAIVVPDEMVTVDGGECDKPGVSLQQWGRDGFCKSTAGTCFAKNLKWFYEYNIDATNGGREPIYALIYPNGHYPRYHAEKSTADEVIDPSEAGPTTLHRLAFSYPGTHISKVSLEMNAGLVRWIQSVSPGQITSVVPPSPRECDNAQMFGCPLKVYVVNSGSTDATFYLELPYCTENGKTEPTELLDPVPATQRNVPAGGSVAFDFTLRLAAVLDEFDFSCVMKLYDADLNQLDVKQFDLLTGIASDLPGAVTNPTGEVVTVDPPKDTRNFWQRLMGTAPNDGYCDCSFWNVLCLPADWDDCWAKLKNMLMVLLSIGLAVVAFILLKPVLKPLIKLLCKTLCLPLKGARAANQKQKQRRKLQKEEKKIRDKLEKEHRKVMEKEHLEKVKAEAQERLQNEYSSSIEEEESNANYSNSTPSQSASSYDERSDEMSQSDMLKHGTQRQEDDEGGSSASSGA